MELNFNQIFSTSKKLTTKKVNLYTNNSILQRKVHGFILEGLLKTDRLKEDCQQMTQFGSFYSIVLVYLTTKTFDISLN